MGLDLLDRLDPRWTLALRMLLDEAGLALFSHFQNCKYGYLLGPRVNIAKFLEQYCDQIAIAVDAST